MQVVRWNGKPISTPGVYSGVPLNVYHSGKLCIGPSISSSGLRTIFRESPRHYWAYSRLNPKGREQPDSEAFVLGRAVHHVILGEPRFKEQFVVRPPRAPDGREWHGSNVSCRAWVKDQEKKGLTILTSGQVEIIRDMALALSQEPLVQAGALNGMVELSFVWQDDETGVWLLARPDNVATDSLDMIDLKTTKSIGYDSLVKALDDYSYQQQGALVMEGYKAITGQDISSFSLYFIEKDFPHCADLRQLKIEDLQRGSLMNRAAIRTFAKCWNSGDWPGPYGRQADAAYIELSERAQTRIDSRLRVEGVLT